MLLSALILLPLAAGLICFLLTSPGIRKGLWMLTALAHLGMSLSCLFFPGMVRRTGWLAADSLSVLFILITSILFTASTVYGMYYMKVEAAHKEDTETSRKPPGREAVMTGFLLIFLSTMSLVIFAGHLGLLWIAVEATTLASAPLIYFHRHRSSLEATWKYLMVCSVGIALALLGVYFLVGAFPPEARPIHLALDDLLLHSAGANPLWLKAAFLLILIGFGTKMGLVPLHTWLPGAHSEAPAPVSALLSGALLNCAFLAILRMYQVIRAAGLASFAQEMLLLFGLITMTAASLLLISKRDYKRMLAYSSIENMGILATGIGLGTGATNGALLHALSHSFVKGALFLSAGNLLFYYKSKKISAIRGLSHCLPLNMLIWMAGFLAITGSPPFAIFTSKLIILRGALGTGSLPVTIFYLGALVLSFIALSGHIFKMAFRGSAATASIEVPRGKETWPAVAPSFILLALVMLIGIRLPASLATLLEQASSIIGRN